MKYTRDRGHNYATLLPRCLSQNCFLPRPSSAQQLCCGADTRRQSVENVKMYGILWLLPCHDRLVCPCLSVSLNCWKTETEQQSRNVVTRAEGGIVRLSQAGDLGGVWSLCGSSLSLQLSYRSVYLQTISTTGSTLLLVSAQLGPIKYPISLETPPNLLIDLNYLCK